MTMRDDDAADQGSPHQHTQHARRPYQSAQERYVAVREIVDDVLCLAPLGANAESASTHERRSRTGPERDYRAILEVSSLNYALKSEGEQEAITVSYQAFLNALAFPVQVLVRVVRLDLSPYLARLDTLAAPQAPAPTADHQEANEKTRTVWQRLARDQADFVRNLAARRTLLERRFYVIVPADGETTRGIRVRHEGSAAGSAGVFRWLPGYRRRMRRAVEEQLANARQQLDLRSGELIRQLGRMGLEARRLHGPELASLFYSCLTPTSAARHPLPGAVITGAGRPVHAPHAMGRPSERQTGPRGDHPHPNGEPVEGGKHP